MIDTTRRLILAPLTKCETNRIYRFALRGFVGGPAFRLLPEGGRSTTAPLAFVFGLV